MLLLCAYGEVSWQCFLVTFTLISFDHLKAILLWAVLNRLVAYVIIFLTLNGYQLKLKLHGVYIFLMKVRSLEEFSGPCILATI